MLIKSHANYIRVTPRKVRFVADAIRSLPVEKALAYLHVLPHKAVKPLQKALISGVANATSRLKVTKDALYIHAIDVNEGPRLKRWQPVSRGMAHGYVHRLSHITIVLSTREDKQKHMSSRQTTPVVTKERSKQRGTKDKS